MISNNIRHVLRAFTMLADLTACSSTVPTLSKHEQHQNSAQRLQKTCPEKGNPGLDGQCAVCTEWGGLLTCRSCFLRAGLAGVDDDSGLPDQAAV